MRPCRVFLAGEGPRDIGDLSRHPTYRGDREGFLQPVVRKLAGSRRIVFEGRKLATFSRARFSGVADALQHKADQAYRAAVATECDLLIFVTDVDRESSRKRSEREARNTMRELHASIEAGFASARKRDDELECIGATPCRMIEAWALGDIPAVEGVSGERVRHKDCTPQEELWGDEDDPDSRHPKCVLRRLVGDPPALERIGELADVDVIASACPVSFAPFAAEVREYFEKQE